MTAPPSPAQENPATATVVVLAVSAVAETHTRLRGILRKTNWRLLESASGREAISMLQDEPIGVVVYEAEPPNDSWQEFFDALQNLREKPLLVVTGRSVDERVWAEALSRGVYDVLARPFDAAEVIRVISLAWLHWRHSRKPVAMATRSATSAAWD